MIEQTLESTNMDMMTTTPDKAIRASIVEQVASQTAKQSIAQVPANKKHRVVYDLEQLSNFHSFTGYNLNTNKIHVFVIHESRNDFPTYVAFLEHCGLMIGYNNLAYDYPMIHYILCNKHKLVYLHAREVTKRLYEESQRIISTKYSEVRPSEVLIPQIDLICVQGLNQSSRYTSLKGLQVAMRWYNVQDMPINYWAIVANQDIPTILEYNLNDVLSTLEFLKYTQDKIEVRRQLTTSYGVDLMNTHDIKMGSEIMAVELSKAKGISAYTLKREIPDYSDLKIEVDTIILPYFKFSIKPFKCVLDLFRESVMTPDTIAGFFTDIPLSKAMTAESDEDGAMVDCVYKYTNKNKVNKRKNTLDDLNVIYEGCEYVFGAGGIHMSVESQIVEEDGEWMIIDADVASFYVNLATENKFYPLHLGEMFCDVYNDLYRKRKFNKDEAKRTGSKALKSIQEGQKLSLVATYGMSKNQYSFLYYPKMTMQICINGQLSLAYLINNLYDALGNANVRMIQANTDGVTFKVKRSMEQDVYRVCKEWEKTTGLELEYTYYKKMIIEGVNSYIAVKTNGDIKQKGNYEEINSKNIDNNWHKDHSSMIIPHALTKFFVHNIPIEETIMGCTDIFMFYMCEKSKSGLKIYSMGADGIEHEEQKVTRFYISKSGISLYKKRPGEEKIMKCNAGYHSTIANRHIEVPIQDRNIDYNYYIRECNKRINTIINNQTTLF